jgi:hypothetical protein
MRSSRGNTPRLHPNAVAAELGNIRRPTHLTPTEMHPAYPSALIPDTANRSLTAASPPDTVSRAYARNAPQPTH